MKPLAFATLCGLTATAHAQMATYTVLLPPAGPVPSGATVEGTIRCAWMDNNSEGYAGGAFRIRMDGLAVGDVLSPNHSNSGINGENASDVVGVPASQLPPGAG